MTNVLINSAKPRLWCKIIFFCLQCIYTVILI